MINLYMINLEARNESEMRETPLMGIGGVIGYFGSKSASERL